MVWWCGHMSTNLLHCTQPLPVASSPKNLLPAKVSTWLSVLIFIWREWLDACRIYREVCWTGKHNRSWEVWGELISWNSFCSLCILYLARMLSLILAEMSFLQPVTLVMIVIGSVSGWDKTVTSMWGQSWSCSWGLRIIWMAENTKVCGEKPAFLVLC